MKSWLYYFISLIFLIPALMLLSIFFAILFVFLYPASFFLEISYQLYYVEAKTKDELIAKAHQQAMHIATFK